MPTLTLKVAPTQPADRCQALASALSQLSTELLGKRHDVTAVLIDGLPAERWFVAGRPVQGATALLEISVTAGTNTPAQKAAFVAAAFAELERQLGQGAPLEPASYVIVRELAASDWGYAGRTQQSRQQAKGPAL